MVKKRFVVILLIFVVCGALFAQERAKNSFAVSFGVFGAELSYERIFNRHFSVLADVSYFSLILTDELAVTGNARVYPFGKAFYLNLGLGYAYGRSSVEMFSSLILGIITWGWYFTTLDEDVFTRKHGFAIQPSIGWKIDIGKPDAFVLPISLGVDIKTGRIPGYLPYLRIGLGYSF